MNENHKEFILEWVAITLFYIAIKTIFKTGSGYFFQFVFGIIGVTLSIGAYLITNQQKEEGDLLRIIIITAIYKKMMIMFTFVALLLEIDSPFSTANVRVQLNILDLWCICVCYIYLFKHINTFCCAMLIGLGCCLVTFLGVIFSPIDGSTMYTGANIILEALMMFISILGLSIVILYKDTQHSKSYLAFILFLACKIIKHFIVCYQYIGGDSRVIMPFTLLRTMEYYYILKCTYLACWEEPWKAKILNLNKVEYTLSDNAYYRDMIVNLSHELKTPINVISSATDLLKLDFEDEKEMMDDLKEMRRYCNETMRIIGNMIDIHKLRGGYTKVVYRQYNLVALIENVVEAYSKQYKEAHLVFNPEEEEIYSQVDKSLFQQIMLYLIYAALKTRRDRSEIYIEIKEQEEGEILIKLSHSQIGAIEEYIIYQAENKDYNADSVMAVELFYHMLKLHEGSINVKRDELAIEVSLYIEKTEQVGEEVILEESNIAELIDRIRSHYVVE